MDEDEHPMRPWIGGTDRFGVVERRDGEHVETEFVCLIGPLWPRRSFYVVHTAEGTHELVLPLHRRSVAAALVRFYAWMGALICAMPALVDAARWGVWLAPAGALAALAGLGHLFGQLPPDERARRDLLKRVVGIGVPPELLPASELEAVRTRLDRRWKRAGAGISWQLAIRAGHADELLVALAEFHLERELTERARAALAPN